MHRVFWLPILTIVRFHVDILCFHAISWKDPIFILVNATKKKISTVILICYLLKSPTGFQRNVDNSGYVSLDVQNQKAIGVCCTASEEKWQLSESYLPCFSKTRICACKQSYKILLLFFYSIQGLVLVVSTLMSSFKL